VSYQPPPGQPPPYPYWQHQPQWQPPPPIDPKRLRPSRLWYWLAAIPAIVGALIGVVLLIAFVEQLDPDIDNFRANEAAAVDLKSGDRAIYIQTRDNNRTLFIPPGELRCQVAFIGSDSLPLKVESAGSSTLDSGSDSYASEFKFHAPHDGPYSVRCDGPADLRLAIGPHLSFGLFGPLLAAIAAFGLGVILAVVVAVVTGVKRSNHKQQLQREAVGRG
jgi:hypothetical protein